MLLGRIHQQRSLWKPGNIIKVDFVLIEQSPQGGLPVHSKDCRFLGTQVLKMLAKYTCCSSCNTRSVSLLHHWHFVAGCAEFMACTPIVRLHVPVPHATLWDDNLNLASAVVDKAVRSWWAKQYVPDMVVLPNICQRMVTDLQSMPWCAWQGRM
jgi:hypothetical protein